MVSACCFPRINDTQMQSMLSLFLEYPSNEGVRKGKHSWSGKEQEWLSHPITSRETINRCLDTTKLNLDDLEFCYPHAIR